MLTRLKTNQYFLIAILLSPFLGYFSGKGIIAYGPLIILMLLVIVLEFLSPQRIALKDWGAVLAWLPYVGLASYYYVSYPLDGRYLTTHLLAIITLPMITLSILCIQNKSNGARYSIFLYRSIRLFLFMQFIICLGQISTYTLGIGLPINEEYRDYFMITGTFYNPNDLGAVTLLIAFIFTGIERQFSLKRQGVIWSLIIILLLMSGSRSALLATAVLFMLTRGFNIKSILLYSLILLFFIISYNVFFSDTESGVFFRFVYRLESLVNILKSGVGIDNSMGLRLDSYLHFIKNINSLGVGSGRLNDYYQYADTAQFKTELMFQNPHSLIVEIGYWLGWPGLLTFALATLYLLQYSSKKLAVILIVGISSLIPSSVLGNLIYFLLINLIIHNKVVFDR